MKVEVHYLPWSGRRYKVSQFGEIITRDGEILQTIERDGELFVQLNWVLGNHEYSVGLLVLVAFEKIKLPDHLFDQVQILYADNNKKNLTPANLFYNFKCGPLPVEEYPGYFYIPMYTDYGITKDGDLINVETGKYKVWSITPTGGSKNQTGGYLYNRVITDSGFSRTLFMHRALCMVFKPYGFNMNKLVVNHIDGNPSNNCLTNIEWSTYAENNQHAYDLGLRPSAANVVLMKDLKTDKVLKFPSLSACARHLGRSSIEFIRSRIENNEFKVFSDMLLFKYEDQNDWPIVEKDNLKICRLGHGADVAVRNVFTGDIMIFSSVLAAAESTGVLFVTIHNHVRNNVNVPINGYNFRYLELAKNWPEHTDLHLQIYKKYPVYPPNGAFVTDTVTGIKKFYTSSAEVMKEFKITKALFTRHVKNQTLLKDRYLLSYFKIRETYGPTTE